MGIPLGQVALHVLLEEKPVNDQRRDGLFFLLLFLRLTRIGIFHPERDPLRIWRPGKLSHPPFCVGHLLGFPSAEGKNPKLIVLAVVLPSREKPDPFSIGTPARMLRAFDAEGKGAVLRTVPFRQPEI